MKKTIGIIGGGQLGLMLLEQRNNIISKNFRYYPNIDYEFYVYDPSFDCSCAKIKDCDVKFFQGNFYDRKKLKRFVELCDIITFEIEHIDADFLCELESNGLATFYPSPKILLTVQNKIKQKLFYEYHDIPSYPFLDIELKPQQTQKELYNIAEFDYEKALVLKTPTQGYDGKGVFVFDKCDVNNEKDLSFFVKTQGEFIVEEKLENFTEISIFVARDKKGIVFKWPALQMVFKDGQNLLDYAFLPSTLPKSTIEECEKWAVDAVEKFNGIGVFAVEFFVTSENKVYINEMAPRPHNSAHHTLHAYYDLQGSVYSVLMQILMCDGEIRYAVNVNQKKCIIHNLIGNFYGPYKISNNLSRDMPGTSFIVDYNKSMSRPARKLGHVTTILPEEETHNLNDIVEQIRAAVLVQLDTNGKVGVVMGSQSDWPTMKEACNVLDELGISYETLVVSAHRTPNRLVEYAQNAKLRSIDVIIAGAGGAAHLPGMLAANTNVCVIGVPVKSSNLSGVDSLYSIVQMPRGVPVATVAIGGAKNAGILAAQIIASSRNEVYNRLEAYREKMKEQVIANGYKLN